MGYASNTPVADFSDAPIAGTPCAWCKQNGHFCPAKGYAGDEAVCVPCGHGEPCSQAVAIERMRRGPEVFEVETPIAECRTIAVDDTAQPVSTRVEPEHPWNAVKASLDAAELLKPKARKKPARGEARPAQASPAQPSPAQKGSSATVPASAAILEKRGSPSGGREGNPDERTWFEEKELDELWAGLSVHDKWEILAAALK